MGTLIQDLRYGLRMLQKNWKLARLRRSRCLSAMALSVAGSSVFNGIMLRPPVCDRARTPGHIYTASQRASSTAFRTRITNTIATAIIRFPLWQLSQRNITAPHDSWRQDETGTVESGLRQLFLGHGYSSISRPTLRPWGR